MVASAPVQPLADRERVHVVVHEHRQLQRGAQPAAERDAAPLQDIGVHHPVGRVVDPAGHGDADPEQRVRTALGPGDGLGGQPGQAGQRAAGAGVERVHLPGAHGAVRGHVGDRHVVPGDLDAEGAADRPGEPEQPRRPTAAGRGVGELAEALGGDELAGQLGDRDRAEPQAGGDLGAAHRSCGGEQGEDRRPRQVG